MIELKKRVLISAHMGSCGYNLPGNTYASFAVALRQGADIIELGVPFSDPMADGPVIQHASEVALEKGMTLKKVLDIVGTFRTRNRNTPVVLMGSMTTLRSLEL